MASPVTYADCREWLDAALESDRGIIITCNTHGEAVNLNQRLHRFRRMDRDSNRNTYPPEHPLHRSSIYDGLFWAPPGPDTTEIAVKKRSVGAFKVRPIPPKPDDE